MKYCRAAPKTLGRYDAQVDLQAVSETHDYLGGAARRHRDRVRKCREAVHHHLGLGRNREEVEVADRFAAAAIAAGHFQSLDCRAILHPSANRLRELVGIGPGESHIDRRGQADPGQNCFLGLRTKALELANLLRLARGSQFVERARP